MERTDSEIVINALSSANDRPLFRVRIPTPPVGFLEKLKARVGKYESDREYVVYPTRVGCMLRITEVIERIPQAVLASLQGEETQVFLNEYLPLYRAHIHDLIEVIALAITNGDQDAPQALKNDIKREFDNTLILQTIQALCRQMHMRDFLTSIVLTKGLKVLPETSREE